MPYTETQTNYMGFEKSIWDITGTHTDTHTHTTWNISTHFFLVWKVA